MKCPICQSAVTRIAATARDRLVTGEGPFEILECPACRLGVTRPQLSNDKLKRYYSDVYYVDFVEWSGERHGSLLPSVRDRWRRWMATRRHDRAPFRSLNMATPGRMLDVGCGDGKLLQHFADLEWDAVGLDPSSIAVEATRKRGLEAYQGTLASHPWPESSFDAIVFEHVLEHIPQPMEALEEAARLLVPGGVVAVVVPNWACWQRSLFRDRWFHLDLPRHQQHFSTLALRRAAERVGLHCELWGTESNVISPAYSLNYVLAGRWGKTWALWLSYALGALVYPLFVLVDRRSGGDCCYVLARKPPVPRASAV
jgi:SAM-dependent methyltransferase